MARDHHPEDRQADQRRQPKKPGPQPQDGSIAYRKGDPAAHRLAPEELHRRAQAKIAADDDEIKADDAKPEQRVFVFRQEVDERQRGDGAQRLHRDRRERLFGYLEEQAR
ncbi:hypothetical protein [Sphingomonas sp.]|uniref:hypothetical protein n=1 Tax=Sphingomonas sp. TaxID=28214 RepID=UPI003D6CD150